jgi:ankyrin repeat protein
MRTIDELYNEIATVPDFFGHNITSPNHKNGYGDSLLHAAAVWDDEEAIDLLLREGADINVKGEHGYTPLLDAVAQGNLIAVTSLLKHGANAISNDDGDTPLELARRGNDWEMENLLISKGF